MVDDDFETSDRPEGRSRQTLELTNGSNMWRIRFSSNAGTVVGDGDKAAGLSLCRPVSHHLHPRRNAVEMVIARRPQAPPRRRS